MIPPVLTAAASRARFTWRRPARPRSCWASSTSLADPCCPEGVAPGDQPAARVHRHAAPSDVGVARQGGRTGLSGPIEPQAFERVDLLGTGGIVDLDHVHVTGARPSLLPRFVGRGPEAVVIVELSVARTQHAGSDARRPPVLAAR